MRLLFTDTETGGTNPKEDALFEVALVVWEDGKLLDKRSWKIRSEDKSYYPSALKINKIDPVEHNKVAISRTDAANEIIDYVEKWFDGTPATLAGHNVSFDRDFLKVLVEEADYDFGYFSHRLLDMMSVLNFIAAWKMLPQDALSSNGIFEYLGIEPEARHTAMGDIEATIKVFESIARIYLEV